MSYGISIVNGNNQILIDQDYKNPGVVWRGFSNVSTAGVFTSLTADPATGGPLTSTIPYLTAIRPRTGSGITIASIITSLIDTNSGDYVGDYYKCHPLTTHPPQEYVLFGTGAPALQDSSDYGLRISNPSGETVYDSRRTYLEVVDVVPIAKPTYPTEQNYTHVALDNAFYVISTLSGFIRNGGQNIRAGIRQNSPTSMTIKSFVINTGGVINYYNAYSAGTILVCRLAD